MKIEPTRIRLSAQAHAMALKIAEAQGHKDVRAAVESFLLSVGPEYLVRVQTGTTKEEKT